MTDVNSYITANLKTYCLQEMSSTNSKNATNSVIFQKSIQSVSLVVMFCFLGGPVVTEFFPLHIRKNAEFTSSETSFYSWKLQTSLIMQVPARSDEQLQGLI